MSPIPLLFLSTISIIANCDGFILPKESNENLIPADLLLDSITLLGDYVKGIDDLKRVERAEKSGIVELASNTLLDGDHVRGIDDLKRVERSPSNSTLNKSSSSSNQSNKSSINQSNSNKNSGRSESNSGKVSSNPDSSSSDQSSKSDNNASQDRNSKENSKDNSSEKSKAGDDDGNDEENLIKSKLHDLLIIPSRIKEAFHRVFKLFNNGDDDDDDDNDGNIDLLKIPRFLNKLKGLFDA